MPNPWRDADLANAAVAPIILRSVPEDLRDTFVEEAQAAFTGNLGGLQRELLRRLEARVQAAIPGDRTAEWAWRAVRLHIERQPAEVADLFNKLRLRLPTRKAAAPPGAPTEGKEAL